MTFYLTSTSICIMIALIYQLYMSQSQEKVAIFVDYALRNYIERDQRKLIVFIVPIANIIAALGLLTVIFMSVERLKRFMEDL